MTRFPSSQIPVSIRFYQRTNRILCILVGMQGLGRSLIFMGALILLIGLLISYGGRLPLRIGRLPGDFVIRGKNSVFYFPLMTSVLLSLILSVVLWLVGRR
jgi:hypothetical protein